MFNYKEEDNLLEISKIPIAPTRVQYEDCDMYQSYMQYVNGGLEKDIRELLIPALSKAVEEATGESLFVKNCKVFFDNHATYKGYEYYSAEVELDGFGLCSVTDPFVIFKLPYMDRFGLLEREGKQYALISELVQDDDITYKDNELKIITKGGCYINLKNTGNSFQPKVMFRKKAYKATQIMFALAWKEGLQGDELFNKLSSYETCNMYRDEEDVRAAFMYAREDAINVYLETLEKDMYNLCNVRDKMNEVLSIDRALGKVLFKDVTLKDGTVLKYGTEITEKVLRQLKHNAINEVYVEDIPNMVGQYLAQLVSIPIIRRGTRIIPCLKGKLEGQDGDYVDRDIVLETPIFLGDGEPITAGLLEMLAYNGYLGVEIKESVTTKTSKYVPFSSAIIGNRHFTKRELSIDNSDEYVYVHEDGTITEPSMTLTAYDMLALIALYDRLEKGYDHDVITDRDLGLRKKVNQANELFHKAFELVVPEYVRMIKSKFLNTYKNHPVELTRADYMESLFFGLSNKWWSKLYTTMRVVQGIDKSNPLSFYSSFAKVNSIIADKNAVKRDQHSISMGHYGRLCPYETPSGKTMGIVSNRAVGCKIVNGVMKTAYYRIKHIGERSFIDKEPMWLTVKDEEKFRIADITSFTTNWETREILTKGRVLARVPSKDKLEKMSVSYVDIAYIDLVNVDPQQTDSLTATSIPFQGANDAARVIFGLSMAKQAKGLVEPEVPRVLTSAFIDAPRKSDYYMLMAEGEGTVVEASVGYIAILYDNGEIKDYKYRAREFSREAVVIRTLECTVDQRVKAGDVLVSSNFVRGGYMATGRNAFVAFAPVGFNYEDGVYGANRMGINLMSYGCNIEKTPIPMSYGFTKVSNVDKFRYAKKDRGMFKLSYIADSTPQHKTVRADHLKGFIIDCKAESDQIGSRESIVKTEAVSLDYLNQGDKIANRHGNKGVTPKIIDNNKMPLFKNGEFVDIVYNPAGVSSRMNIGQVLECHLGLVGHILDIYIRSDSFNGATIGNVAMLLQFTWDVANLPDLEAVLAKPEYAEIPEGLKNKVRRDIEQIRIWKGCFNPDGTAWLINPRTGKYYETPVLVGVNYIYKLIHEVHKKVHARAGYCDEPYVEKLSAPPKGSSNRGGQRFGYMELDALLAYGAVHLMEEMLNERGDNPVARNNATVDRLHKVDTYKLNPDTAIRRSTEYFVSILEALGVHVDFEGLLPNKVKEDFLEREVYKSKALIKAEDIFVGDSARDSGSAKSLSAMASELEDLL